MELCNRPLSMWLRLLLSVRFFKVVGRSFLRPPNGSWKFCGKNSSLHRFEPFFSQGGSKVGKTPFWRRAAPETSSTFPKSV